MSLVERETTAARVAASQANGKKSKGPKTPEGKARASLNSLKTGAYAKTDNALREIMLRRGEDPAFFDQLHLELTEGWQPDDVMQAMAVKAIAEKSFDKASLRAAWMESQLTASRVGEIQAQRRELLARRWCPGALAVELEAQGLWQAKDRPSKFKRIFDLLDCLQKWLEDQVCPDEYPGLMRELYGECPSKAGETIRLLVIDFFGSDEAAAAKAAQELPKWMAQERRDVEQERDLYQREMALRSKAGPTLVEEQVAKKEAALEKQISEQTRLLLQLKLKRSQWWRPPEEQGIGDREQGTGNREQGTGNREQGIGNRAQGTANREQGTANREQGTANREQGTGNREQGTDSGPESTAGESAVTVPGKAPTRAETVPDGATVAAENAEKGQSNLVSAA